jgi:hypothetical protein
MLRYWNRLVIMDEFRLPIKLLEVEKRNENDSWNSEV